MLVFGAGTNYALLLIARYREELRREPDRRLAMARAWARRRARHRGERGTVVLSLLALSFAVLGSNRSVGQFGALGIAWRPSSRCSCCPRRWCCAGAGCSGRSCRGSAPPRPR